MSAAATPTELVVTPSPAVIEEERLLSHVKRALAGRRPEAKLGAYDQELVRLRDSLSEARLAEDQASLLEQMDRVASLSVARAKHHELPVDPQNPYFGHLALEDDAAGKRMDVLIGKQTFISGGVRIVDWRNAPISRLFYQRQVGDDYEITLADKERSGEILVRRTVTIQDGELVRISDHEGTYVRTGGDWQALGALGGMHGGAGRALRPEGMKPVMGTNAAVRQDKLLPEIAGLLDSEQFKLITDPKSGVVAISGAAGSGKTTVALHRMAWLAFAEPRKFAPENMLIVVYSKALAVYVSKVLPALGVTGVHVRTYDHLIRELCRRHYPHLPILHADDTPAVVTRYKLHWALVPMLAHAAYTHQRKHPYELFSELFTDREWLAQINRFAPGAFSDSELAQLLRWNTRMHFRREHRDADEVEVQAGEDDPDERTPDDDDPPRLDPEDDTILVRLWQLMRGPLRDKQKQPIKLTHLVVDEVQDLSPVEVSVLTELLGKGKPITFAGDEAQKIMGDNGFESFEQLLRVLRLEDTRRATLKVSYRSTAQIMEVADHVLGHMAPGERAHVPREGAPVEAFEFMSRGEAAIFLSDALRSLTDEEPNASIAVLTRYEYQAESIWEHLTHADLPRLRRVRDFDFPFVPGIDVADVRQAKGLEFDYVVIFDADGLTFGESDDARHLLHVAITRAAHQCWLIAGGPLTTLVPEWVKVLA